VTRDDSPPIPSETLVHPPGCRVRLLRTPTYLRTADERPMLRPPDLVDPEEWGTVTAVRPGDLRAVRFRRGSFLVPADLLLAATGAAVNGEGDGPD
jgi:Protein of unknown function (DUF3148)